MAEAFPGGETVDAPRVRSLLEEGLDRDMYTGAVAVSGGPESPLALEAVGRTSPDGADVTAATPFDVASLTKPIVTTTVFFRLLERGALTLTDTVGDHVPALERRRRGEIPLHRLLTHTSGLRPYAFSEAWEGREEALADLYERRLFDRRLGDGFVYSCLNYVHLAEVLRQATGESLATLAEEHVFEPAGMTDASLGPYESPPSPVVATYDREYDGRGEIVNEIHDPIANAMDGESGNAGLFASSLDAARFARSILADARGTNRLLSAPTVDCLAVRRSGTDAASQGYGWRVATDLIPAPQWSARAIGHTGFTGTSLWIDVERERFACLLTNAVYRDMQLYRFRQRYHAIVAAGA